jgi:hypothetical protein
MKYVKHFSINGIDTKQVACIELQGRPNAATEGAVGLLGIDITSPTHDVYKCVAVNGSIYTWELLSSGMSIMSATITGEGGGSKSFPYSTLLVPENYLLKVGDLVLDSEGYLYQISNLGSESCETTYTGNFLGGGAGGSDRELELNGGKLQLVAPGGTVINEIDYLLPDGTTIVRDTETGIGKVRGIYTKDNDFLEFFKGKHTEYDALADANKDELFPIFTDDAYVTQRTFDALVETTDNIANEVASNHTDISEESARAKAREDAISTVLSEETTRAKKAEGDNAKAISEETARAKKVEGDNAKAISNEITRAQRAEGDNAEAISTERARAMLEENRLSTEVSNIKDGRTTVYKASRDSLGQVIITKYATKSELEKITNGTTVVAKATVADSATRASEAAYATKATQDGNGKNIVNTYATKASVNNIIDGITRVARASSADSAMLAGTANSATKATRDGEGQVIADTYATKEELKNTIGASSTKVAQASSADSATKATQDADGNNIVDTYATKASVTTISTNITDIVNGTTRVAKASSADSATHLSPTAVTIDHIGNEYPLNILSENGVYVLSFATNSSDYVNRGVTCLWYKGGFNTQTIDHNKHTHTITYDDTKGYHVLKVDASVGPVSYLTAFRLI